MDVVSESRIRDEFKGWGTLRLFELDDGTMWQQIQERDIFKFIYRPRAKVHSTEDGHLLEVEGMLENVKVKDIG